MPGPQESAPNREAPARRKTADASRTGGTMRRQNGEGFCTLRSANLCSDNWVAAVRCARHGRSFHESEPDSDCASVAASPRANILLIPGTSSIDHLRENLEAAALQLSPETIAELDAIVDSSER